MAYVTFSNVICLLGYPSPFILIQVRNIVDEDIFDWLTYLLSLAVRVDRLLGLFAIL
jgi:hypothetical protein